MLKLFVDQHLALWQEVPINLLGFCSLLFLNTVAMQNRPLLGM